MTETIQKQRLSLVERVCQMAGAADTADALQHEEPPVVLPDGYRRRLPVQRSARRSNHMSRRTAMLLWGLFAVLLVIIVVLIIIF